MIVTGLVGAMVSGVVALESYFEARADDAGRVWPRVAGLAAAAGGVAMGAVACLSPAVAESPVGGAACALLGSSIAACAAFDARARTVPTVLVVCVGAAGLALGKTLSGLGPALMGAFGIGLLTAVPAAAIRLLRHRRAIAPADIALLAALGAVWGFSIDAWKVFLTASCLVLAGCMVRDRVKKGDGTCPLFTVLAVPAYVGLAYAALAA